MAMMKKESRMYDINKIFIIAEAGCNHNGDLRLAAKLIHEAKICGADAIKFQAFRTENLIRKGIKKSAHLKNIKSKDSVFGAMKKLEFSKKDYIKLRAISRREKIILFASVFDIESLRLVTELDFPIIKIPSGEIVNLELLNEASKLGKPIILSTGMSDTKEIERAVDIVLKNLKSNSYADKSLIDRCPAFKKRLILMHTVSVYPSAPEELNLKAINTLRNMFDLPVGYSDHTIGKEACLAAVVLGAQLIEKHFTLDKDMGGPDHKASIEPRALKNLVEKIRIVTAMLGNGTKKPSLGEKKMTPLFRRSVIAKKDIKKGEMIRKSMLEIKRPLDGIGCEKIDEVIGLRAVKNIKSGASIRWKDLLSNDER